MRRGSAILNKALHAVATLGGDYLGGVIYSALKKYDRVASPAGRANAVAVIRDLAREARKSNIDIGLEAVNRYETNLLNTGAQILRFIDEVGEPNVYVHLDTFHMNIEEADCVGVIKLSARTAGISSRRRESSRILGRRHDRVRPVIPGSTADRVRPDDRL